MNTHRGFSLLELVITMGIVAAIAAIVAVSFSTFQKTQIEKTTVDDILSAIDTARTSTLSSKNSSAFGVHLTANQVVIFEGTTYSAGAATNKVVSFDSRASLGSISLTGGGNDIVFNRLTGETSSSGTMVVSVTGLSLTKTITVNGVGIASSN